MEQSTNKTIILEQIEKVRDLDSETSKPKLHTKPDKTVKKTIIKAPSVSTSLYAILTPYLRTPVTGKSEPRNTLPPPITCTILLYFGILFIVQTLRSELKAGTITPRHKRFVLKFLRNYPPETLNIPGPLVALFESLNPAKPSNTLFATVTPKIYHSAHNLRAGQLINYDRHDVFRLSLPYIPGILGFIQKLITAAPAAIPDFTLPNAFDNTAERTLNGHVFQPNQWNEIERATLLLPGMLYIPETNRDIDTSFNRYGDRLNVPTPIAASNIRYTDEFCFLNQDDSWFGNVSQVMSTYCNYFVGSSTLATCSDVITTAPLAISDYTKGSTPNPEDNPIHTLTRAFHPTGIFELEYQHSTTEVNIAPTAAMIATGTKTNCRTSLPELGLFSELGTNIVTRTGPYWLHTPVHRITTKETTYKVTGAKNGSLRKSNPS
ncbi:hypothetical protein WA026_010218 [Henosepilachna vigintioctopunctata]|uniref:Uncharacterized protein n=1 Tax=Henosepilachna vigintioctopunctata TaxID=420089 RepID=A0AAW1UGN0_9CUCU